MINIPIQETILSVVFLTCVSFCIWFYRMSGHFANADLTEEDEELLQNQLGDGQFRWALFLRNVGATKKYRNVRGKLMHING